jgi:hypothetical protein
MEFTFTPLRVAILVALIGAFALCGGFELLAWKYGFLRKPGLYSILMLVSGAVLVSITDHWVGNLDRSNLRWLYVFMGLLAMGGGLMYQHVLHERAAIEFKALGEQEPGSE